MLQFNKVNATPAKLDQWVQLGVNVLLIGEKGVGKTQRVIDAFKRNNLKFAYFSGSTLDPWIHLIGIPKVRGAEGQEKMDFILPSNLDEDIEALFIDEYNRTHKLVKNALLELQQFKSINGRKFPKLKMVWAAINPPKSDSDANSQDYDVEQLDPAQLDRFHVIVELPNAPDKKYFVDKYGDHHGNILINWWKDQSDDAKKILSPRRLDYIGEFFNKGGDVYDLLPVSANTKDLVTKLATKKEDALLHSVFANPTEDVMKLFLLGDQNYLKYKDKLNEPRFWKFHKYLKQEYICANIKNSGIYKNYAILQGLKKDVTFTAAITAVSNSTMNNDLLKVLKLLEAQNLDISKFEITTQSTNNLLTSLPPSVTTNDLFSVNPAILVAGKTKKIDFTVYRSLGTNVYISLMEDLVKSWSNVPNHYDVINFTCTMVGSFQTTTFTKYKSKLLPLIGTCCMLAKQKLNTDEQKQIRSQIHINKAKIGDTHYNEFINYLRGDSDETSVIISEDFEKKVNEASMLVALSSNIK
jgi:MoxR-like ATPase